MSTQAAPILDRIIQSRRATVARMQTSASGGALEERARLAPPVRDFRQAIRRAEIAIIAECKQRSPSGGVLRDPYDPVDLAQRYVAGGAAAISVLTEPEFFGGTMAHLAAVRASVDVPVLCKDFIIDPIQVLEARAAGADAILLIVAVLEPAALHALHAAIIDLGMQALVEVHTENDVERALALRPAVLGINNRDLTRMTTNRATTSRLRPLIPDEYPVVSESGIQNRADIIGLRAERISAALVGESLLRAPDLDEKIRELTGR
ncbi:MAG: indole-3-glycerol phosphate synthase TrpC [Candidatus Dormibacter sp.]|mgnify:CR=1 FL=1